MPSAGLSAGRAPGKQSRACPLPLPPAQTLNLENYEMAMFMIIRASNYGAAAYFISWIVLGADRPRARS